LPTLLARVTRGSARCEFRLWYAWTYSWSYSTLPQRVAFSVQALTWPFKIVWRAGVAVRDRGAVVRDFARVSLIRQWLHCCRLTLMYGIPAECYYTHRLFDAALRMRAPAYIHVDEQHRVLTVLMDRQSSQEAAILSNKGSFHAWCVENSLPTAHVVGEFDQGRPVNVSLALPESDLFAKPTKGKWGEGARSWRWDGSRGYIDSGGRMMQPAELITEMSSMAAETPYLLQERLQNHPDIAELTSGALCTLRIVTGGPPGQPSAVIATAFRMPAAPLALVDNFHAGGIVSAVDESGRLGPAAFKDVLIRPDPFDQHPSTGAKITGMILPHWADAVALALRAHAAAGRIAFVGWDIAVTPSGPVLIEANPSFGVEAVQVASRSPLGDTVYLTWLNEHLRATFHGHRSDASAPAEAPATAGPTEVDV
jgi:hypothetical protein